MANYKLFTTLISLFSLQILLGGPFLMEVDAATDNSIHIESVEFSDETPIPEQQDSPKPMPNVPPKPFVVFKDYESKTAHPFRFSLSERLLDFGQLSPSNPINRSLQLSLSSESLPGYTVFGWENHPLQQNSGVTIPDTTCDNGACSEMVAAPWNSGLTYGFGFRCENTSQSDCSTGFADKDTFMQFSDRSINEDMGRIMTGWKNSQQKQALLTMKVNTPGTQPSGAYSTSITLLAAPGF